MLHFSKRLFALSNFSRHLVRRSFADVSDINAEMEENIKLTAEELRQKLREREDPEDVEYTRFRYPSFYIDPNDGEFDAINRRRKEVRFGVKKATDILVIGGGIMGTAIAYFLKQTAPDSFDLTVVEKDPQYTHSATALSIGGMRQQFSLPENILMANYSANFFRQLRLHLNILEYEPPDIEFNPKGHLFLGNERNSNELITNHQLQSELGTFADILNRDQLKQKFPWLNIDDLLIGSYGVQNEGWFDPKKLLLAFKGKAEFLGVDYIPGEVIDFNMKKAYLSSHDVDETGQPRESANNALIKLSNGHVINMLFSRAVIATGAHSAELSRLLGIGEADGLRSYPLPIEPRKRYIYAFNCPEGPCLDFPFLVDPSGVFCRRDGLGGNFLCGKNPSEEEEPDCSNLDVDYNYFHEVIHPILSHRVPAFKDIKLAGAWAGFYDYNTYDQSPIIGTHPYFKNIYWATGFGGHGVQMAPAVGRAIQELNFSDPVGQYETLDLRRFGWGRIFSGEEVRESLLL